MTEAFEASRIPRRGWFAVVFGLFGLLGLFGPFSFAVTSLAQGAAAPIDVWIDLSAPLAAGAPHAAEATRRSAEVSAQQDRVAARLHELGAVELARVRHVRNAMLVRIAPHQLQALRALPEVVRVRPAKTLHPPKPMP